MSIVEITRRWLIALLAPPIVGAILLYGYDWGQCAALGVPPQYIRIVYTDLLPLPFSDEGLDHVVRAAAAANTVLSFAFLFGAVDDSVKTLAIICFSVGTLWAALEHRTLRKNIASSRLLQKLRAYFRKESCKPGPFPSRYYPLPRSVRLATFLYSSAFVAMTFSYAMGYDYASHQHIFPLIRSKNTEEIGLVRFGDEIVTVPYDSDSGTALNDFTVMEISSDDAPTLTYERLPKAPKLVWDPCCTVSAALQKRAIAHLSSRRRNWARSSLR